MNSIQRTLVLALCSFTLLYSTGCTPSPAKLVDEHFSKALDLADDGDIEGALNEYAEALKIDSDHVPSLVNRGALHSVQGNYNEGYTDCSRAVELEPQEVNALMCRGTILYSLNKPEDAIADFNAILDLDPGHIYARLMRGTLYAIIGERELSISDLNIALADLDQLEANDSELALAFFNRGFIHFYKSDYSQAISDLTQALNFNPEYIEAMAVLGNAYDNNGDFEKALDCYARALEMDTEGNYHALILLDRGQAYAYRNLKEEAIADLNDALELGLYPGGVELAEQILQSLEQPVDASPQTAEEHYQLAMDYRDQGFLAESIIEFTRTIELDPDYLYVYNERGLAFYALGNLENALDDFNRAIEQVPDDAFAFNNRGLVYQDLGDLDAAIQDFTQACELDPSYVHGYFNRGLAFMQIESFEPAIADISKVIELVPEDTSAYYFRGIAYAFTGKLRFALSDLTFVIENSQNDAQIALSHYFRGRVYLNSDEPELALADLEVALDMGLPSSFEEEVQKLLAERD